MKIASWNVNSLNVRLPQLQQWLAEFAPDVVGLQETKLEDHRFPDDALLEAGYRSVFHGQKTYNGVAILARDRAIEDVQVAIPGFEDAQARAIAATVGGVRIINLKEDDRLVGAEIVEATDLEMVDAGEERRLDIDPDEEAAARAEEGDAVEEDEPEGELESEDEE